MLARNVVVKASGVGSTQHPMAAIAKMHIAIFPVTNAAVLVELTKMMTTMNDAQNLLHQLREEFTVSQFSHLVHDKRLDQLLVYLNQYAGKDVPNPVYSDIKSVSGSVVEHATDMKRWPPTVWEHRASFSHWDYDVSYMNNVPGKLKLAEKAYQGKAGKIAWFVEYLEWLLPILRELNILATEVIGMKARVVKRQPKPVEDLHQKFVAPMASNEKTSLIIKALQKMTEMMHADYAKAVTKHLTELAEALDKMTYEDQSKSKNMAQLSSAIWEPISFQERRHQPRRLKADYKTTLTAVGIDAANQMQQQFVAKNASKLASILDAKPAGIDGAPTILKAQATRYGVFEGDMRVSFTDSSSFEVRNQVVFKWSQYGKMFNQFPTTFHNVILPNGKRMADVSEESMNKVFSKA